MMDCTQYLRYAGSILVLAANTGPLSWEAASFSGIPDTSLMMIAQAPDSSWFEIYRSGLVHRVTSSGIRSSAPLLTINAATEGEMGLLGLAIHPNYPADPYLYFYYTTLDGTTRIHVDQYSESFDRAIRHSPRNLLFPWTKNSYTHSY